MHATTSSNTSRFSKTDGSRPTTRIWNASNNRPFTTTNNHTPPRSSKPRWLSSAVSTKTGSRLSSATLRCSSTTTALSTSLCQPTTTPSFATHHLAPSPDPESPAAELPLLRPQSPAAWKASVLLLLSPFRNASACTATQEKLVEGHRHHHRRQSAWRPEHPCHETAVRPSDSRHHHLHPTTPHTELRVFSLSKRQARTKLRATHLLFAFTLRNDHYDMTTLLCL